MPNPNAIDALGQQLGAAALRTLIRLCPEVRTASTAQLDAACATMRAQTADVIDQLLDDAKPAPWLADAALATAALTLAQAGIEALRGA